MTPLAIRLAAALSILLLAGSAQAVQVGLVNDFQDGTTQDWGSGGSNPTPPMQVGDGGPTGMGDGFLRLQSSGNPGPGGKLTAFTTQSGLTGNYLDALVASLTMDLINLGEQELTLRLQLSSAAGRVVTQALVLPLSGTWVNAVFDVDVSSLTAVDVVDVSAVLMDVTEVRIMHSPEAVDSRSAPPIAGALGIDNVTVVVVPEPATGLLVLAALGLLAGRRQPPPRSSR